MSETKPWSKYSLHLSFENIFNPMRKPQNNSDQSAFHLSAAHIDVQLILLMAALEENKKSIRHVDNQSHVHAHSTGIVKKQKSFHEDL